MIILSLPYKNQDSFQPRIPLGTDLAEFRLDYCSDLAALDFSQFTSRHILSYRDIKEGGKNTIKDKVKIKLYRDILSNSNALIDCEYLFLKRYPEFQMPADRLILSLHTDVSKHDLIRDFLKTDIKAKYYKLALKSTHISAVDALSEQVPSAKKDRLILVPLAPLSLTYRLLFRLYGSQGTYVYLKEKTALNQPSLVLSNACRIDKITPQTELYGIIGNRKVAKSLSVFMHNYCFQRNKQDIAMLPVMAGTPSEALQMVDWLRAKANLKGLAITMPFKKKIPHLITGERSIANSWLVDSNTFINTDETAMDLALDTLRLPKSSSVLILGTGATSQIAQKVLQQKGFENYQILTRQQLKERSARRLSKNRDLIFYKRFDLLINCTPFGLKPEDNPKLLPGFDALIDLPYGTERTTLVSYALKKDLPHVSGTVFWKWQALEQAEFFGLDLKLEQRLI